MAHTNLFLFMLIAACGLTGACGGGDDATQAGSGNTSTSSTGGTGGSGGSGGSMADACPVVVKESDCDTSLRPIVFVHGTYGSGDNIGNVALLFGSNGFCQDRFVAIDYNSLGEQPIAKIDALVDKVLADTGLDKVELMGHSQGTTHSLTYLSDPQQAAKVAHYVHIAGGSKQAPAGVPTLSLSSDGDTLLGAAGAMGAEKTVVFTTQDHFAVAASTESFIEIYKYLRGTDPQYTEVQCGEETITLEGVAESFADNTPNTGTLEVYELGDSPRDQGAPVMTLTGGTDGHVGPFQAKRLQAYEFKGFDANHNLVGHVYFAPFKRSDRLLRFLSPSQNALAAGLTTDKVVTGPNHVAVVARFLGGAFRKDLGDSLTIDGAEVLSDDNASATSSTVGLFMFDNNTNGQSDLGAVFTAPFVVGTDVFMPASEPAFLDMRFNGKAVKVPNWPSDSEGQVFVMFP